TRLKRNTANKKLQLHLLLGCRQWNYGLPDGWIYQRPLVVLLLRLGLLQLGLLRLPPSSLSSRWPGDRTGDCTGGWREWPGALSGGGRRCGGGAGGSVGGTRGGAGASATARASPPRRPTGAPPAAHRAEIEAGAG